MEPVAARRPVFDRRIAFDSPVVRIARWKCRGSREAGAERAQERPRIVFVRSGNFRVHSSQEIGLLDCTRVGFFNANVPFRSAHPYSGGDSGADFAFRPDLLPRVFGPAADDGEHPFRAGWGPADTESFLLQSLVLRKAAAPAADELEVEELSLRLLARIAAPVAGDGPPAEHAVLQERDMAEALRGFLSAHPAARHRLDDLAGRFGSDPFQLCRGFRAVTGTTIHRFLTDVRLRRAIGRLAEGCRDLSELAFDLGFSSHSHFTATFRRRLGITPDRVRGIAGARHPSRLYEALRSSTARN